MADIKTGILTKVTATEYKEIVAKEVVYDTITLDAEIIECQNKLARLIAIRDRIKEVDIVK